MKYVENRRPDRAETVEPIERNSKRICAILTADWHLSLNPPTARSVETDWLAVQANYLRQITDLAKRYECVVTASGDLFDRHNSYPAVINMALANMPQVYAVPGNHDLPNHVYEDVHRSAYQTLVEAGKLIDLKPGEPISVNNLRLHGFPFDSAVKSFDNPHNLALEVAVIHAYCWYDRKKYPDAPETHHASKWTKKLKGYDIAVFGDNHIPFEIGSDSQCTIFNCGSLQRRRSDERDYRPSVGLLHDNGRVERHYLDVSADKFTDAVSYNNSEESNGDIEGFVAELAELGDKVLDFPAAIDLAMEKRKTSKEQRAIVLTAMES